MVVVVGVADSERRAKIKDLQLAQQKNGGLHSSHLSPCSLGVSQ